MRPFQGLNQLQVILSIIQGELPKFCNVPWPSSPDCENVSIMKFEELCQQCWNHDPGSRPQMKDVASFDIFVPHPASGTRDSNFPNASSMCFQGENGDALKDNVPFRLPAFALYRLMMKTHTRRMRAKVTTCTKITKPAR